MSAAPPHTPRRPARPPARDPLREENAKLVAQVQHLRRALEAAAQENRQLRRSLARARAENQNARARANSPGSPPLATSGRYERSGWVRVMLSDSHSRNP
jgi:hypothetical protein